MTARNQPAEPPVAAQGAPARTPPPGALPLPRRFERRGARASRTVFVEPPPPAVEPLAVRDSLSRRALVAADLGAMGVALFATAAAGLKVSSGTALLVVVLVALAKALGLYDRDELLLRKTTLEETPHLALLAVLTVLAGWLLEDVVFGEPLRQGAAIGLWAILTPALAGTRTAARLLVQRRMSPEKLLLLGDRATYERLSRSLGGSSAAQLVAHLAPERVLLKGPDGRPHVSLKALEGMVRWLGVQRIVVSGQDAPPDVTLELFRAAKGVGVRLSFLPAVLATVGPRLAFDDVWGIPLIGVRRFGLTRTQRLAKRAFDLAGGLYALLVAAPVLAFLALAIKLDSPGPVFFRQPRVGRDGSVFCIFKFRTMVADAEARKAELGAQNEAGGGLFKIENDPRITRVGRLLRRTSLDELPQLLNVVRGEMSLVGPRPLVLDEDERILGFDRRRLDLTPGMTGHWQILGSARVPLDEMVRIDYRYVASWTLWEDTKILLRTVPYMLARRGM
ncbi:MAG TPA: exopolysaccharide biosynthesis polyprenyl glycosylphosphotransferase [Solirubrobacteraceae bacterium]|jgi:exopolysaccharide biosynthesis polyprenyl glycosylphosphotransferase